MTPGFLPQLTAALAEHGYREVADASRTIAGALLLLKRQTWNTNRAVVAVELPEAPAPADFGAYVRRLRGQVARRCRFLPVLWGIGIQVVVLAPGFARNGIQPAQHVARLDNQWAIVQSVFLVDPEAGTYDAANSWGQLFTGKHQDTIDAVLAGSFQPRD